jgi:hypothetical protein
MSTVAKAYQSGEGAIMAAIEIWGCEESSVTRVLWVKPRPLLNVLATGATAPAGILGGCAVAVKDTELFAAVISAFNVVGTPSSESC